MLISAVVEADERIALVIGNSDYEEISPLANPRNDAQDVAARLQALGFELFGGRVFYDLGERSMLNETDRFAEAAEGADIAFLYFAGHGMQFNGDPHLLPVDVPDARLSVVRREAIGLNSLLANLAGRAELTVAVFDACREIPDYSSRIKRASRGGNTAEWRGLSRPDVRGNSTLIAYSGGSGELVADGDGRNSPYTEMLLAHLDKEKMKEEKLDVPDVFSEVSYQFRLRYNGQRPEVINQGVRPNRFYFAGQKEQTAYNVKEDFEAGATENIMWQSVERGNTVAEYNAYLKRYPEGFFAEIAKARIEAIGAVGGRESSSTSTPEPAPPQVPEQPVAATTGRLTITAEPSDARVRIMNIVPRYRDGIELDLDEAYDVLVTKAGYEPWRRWVLLTETNQQVLAVLKRRSVSVRKDYEPEMVFVKGGCFQMGSAAREAGRTDDERQHRICVDDMYAGKYEVTFAEYDVFARATNRRWPDDRGWGRGERPVINVNWLDAIAYTKWLSKMTGKRYRLPTEAEWEYSARGGGAQAYPWGSSVGVNNANCRGCGSRWGGSQSAPTGSFEPNGFGLYDTVGNVWEWTCSEWDAEYRGEETRCNYASDGRRSLRGGSWNNKSDWVRSANRNKNNTGYRFFYLGFRVFQDIK